MRHLLLNDFKILMKNWASILILMLIPLVVVFILVKAMTPVFEKNIFIRPFSVGVVDYDKSVGSKIAISGLQSEGYISKAADIKVIDEKEAMKRLNQGNLLCVVIIPVGFSQSLYLGENKPIKVYINKNDGTSAKLFEFFFNNSAELVTAAQSGIYTVYHMMLKSNAGSEEAYRIANKAIPDFMLNAMGRKDVFETVTVSNMPETDAVHYYTVCVSVMFLMFAGILGLRLINQDIESNVIKRFLISPEGIFKYIIEKITVMIIIGLAEFVAVMMPVSLYFKVSFAIFNFKLILTVIAIILVSTSFCILISALSKSSAAASAWSIIALFIVCMASGCLYPSVIMSDGMKTVSGYIFSSWALEGTFRSLADEPLTNIVGIWGALIALSAGMIALSTIVIGRRGFKFLQD